jgi:hypothetical protein
MLLITNDHGKEGSYFNHRFIKVTKKIENQSTMKVIKEQEEAKPVKYPYLAKIAIGGGSEIVVVVRSATCGTVIHSDCLDAYALFTEIALNNPKFERFNGKVTFSNE